MSGRYRLLRDGEEVPSETPGTLAGWRPGRIFGRLDCRSGMRMRRENRVFFEGLEDAVAEGYRPCKKCRPLDEESFATIRHLVPYTTLDAFYDAW